MVSIYVLQLENNKYYKNRRLVRQQILLLD